MVEKTLSRHSLTLYKQKAARVTEVGDKKIMIEVDDGSRLSVRPKDVVLLHPGPLESLARLKNPPNGEIQTAWELLAGETTTLAELAELAYGDFTPAAAWTIWQMVEDGLYFSGSPEEIAVRTAEAVAQEKEQRAAKAAEEAAWNACLARIEANEYAPEDERYLAEVVDLALGRREQSRLLRALGRAETAENGHALLLSLGYWPAAFNPYPQRFGMATTPPDIFLPSFPDETRRDLTHLLALAIDDAGSQDPDDALSWADGRLWVHVADPAALIPPDSPADLEARARATTLYLPEGAVPMLPPAAVAQLGLGLQEVSPALSLAIEISPQGEIKDVEIMSSWVRVTRLTYEQADERLDAPAANYDAQTPLLQWLYEAAVIYETRRHENGAITLDLPETKVQVENGVVSVRPLPSLRSRDLVREAMLMAGEAVARYALEHNIPLPFAGQDPPEEGVEINAGSLAAAFALRRKMRPSQKKIQPTPHAGLGLEQYVQCTSPMRRYLDLVVHQQLRAHLRGAEPLDGQALMERVGAADAVSGDARQAERLSLRHWTLVYLLQNPAWRGEGIVVEKRGARCVVLIPDLDLETQLYPPRDVVLDERLKLQLQEVKLADLEAYFTLWSEN